MHYYVSKGDKTIGPCNLKDLRSFLYYGSVKPTDMVMRENEEEWSPLHLLPELAADLADDNKPGVADLWGQYRSGEESLVNTAKKLLAWCLADKQKPKAPARVQRYQDYGKVPHEQRSGPVLWNLITGFLFWPPRLWRATATIFQCNIFRKAKDTRGFQRIWPRWTESVVAVAVVINTAAWLLAVMWLYPKASTLVHHTIEMSRDAWQELMKEPPGGMRP